MKKIWLAGLVVPTIALGFLFYLNQKISQIPKDGALRAIPNSYETSSVPLGEEIDLGYATLFLPANYNSNLHKIEEEGVVALRFEEGNLKDYFLPPGDGSFESLGPEIYELFKDDYEDLWEFQLAWLNVTDISVFDVFSVGYEGFIKKTVLALVKSLMTIHSESKIWIYEGSNTRAIITEIPDGLIHIEIHKSDLPIMQGAFLEGSLNSSRPIVDSILTTYKFKENFTDPESTFNLVEKLDVPNYNEIQ